ncbi:hypothetical protein FOA52_013684 [Chlamydomonas sp. UWO 241]|nr:hypothetical protein FOA52_013684 [Chlamydomonas sp. UWO 241]
MQEAPNSLFYNYPSTSGPRKPPGRWAHTGVRLGNSSTAVFFGGMGKDDMLDDVWLLDIDTLAWSCINPSAATTKDRPIKTMSHASAAVDSKVYVHGGQQGKNFIATLFVLDTQALSWSRIKCDTKPCARAGHAMTTVGSHVYMFGGQGKKFLNDLWRLDSSCNRFAELTTTGRPPTPRRGQSFCYDGRDSLVTFGGTSAHGIDNQLAVYRVSAREWYQPVQLGAVPSPRTNATLVLLAPNQLLLFGGCNAQGTFYIPHGEFYNDAFVLETSTFTWHALPAINTAPTPRYAHSCIVTQEGSALIYGGINSKTICDGVAVAVSRFPADICHIADELHSMVSSSGHITPATESVRGTVAGSVRGTATESARSEADAGASGSGWAPYSGLWGRGGEGLDGVRSDGVRSHTPPPPSVGGHSVHSASQAASQSLWASSQGPTHRASSQGHRPSCGGGSEAAGGQAPATANVRDVGILRSQLADLLARRGMEERASVASTKAAMWEAELEKERDARSHAQRSGAQLSLLLDEAKRDLAAARARASDAEARASREASAAAECRAATDAATVDAAAARAAAAEASARNEGLVRERSLEGAAASRQGQQGARARAGGGGGSGSSSARGGGDELLLQLSRTDIARCHAAALTSGTTSDPTTSTLSHALGDGPHSHGQQPGHGQGGDDATAAHAAVSSPLPSTSLQTMGMTARESDLATDLAVARGDAVAARADAARLRADPATLASMPLQGLIDLERTLEAALRSARDATVAARVAGAARAASAAAEQDRGAGGAACCSLCMERPRSVVFNCGHQACGPCGTALVDCAFCRVPITARIKLFDV